MVCLAVLCSTATPALAAAVFQIRGGGDGHGIGMSQYGAYGYALHGWSYRAILAHYYSGTAIGTTDPNRTVRVLLADRIGGVQRRHRCGHEAAAPGHDLSGPGPQRRLAAARDGAGRKVGVFPAPLRVSGPGAARAWPASAPTAARSSSVPTAPAGSRRSMPSPSTTTCAA